MRVHPIVATLVAIVIWCFSPTLVTLAKGNALPAVVAATATFIAATAAHLFALIADRSYMLKAGSKIRLKGYVGRAFVLGFLAFAAYPAAYFFALQNGNPIAANLINYLWPVVGAFVALFRARSPLTLELVLGATFGFAGAALSFSFADIPLFQGRRVSEAIWPYLSAFVAALCYGFYSGFLPKTNRAEISSVNEDESDKFLYSDFLCMIFVGGFLFAPPVLVWAMFSGELEKLLISSASSLIALISYGILMAVAHFAWLYGVSRSKSEAPFIVVFLVPVGGTSLLAFWDNSLSVGFLSSLSLVLCGIYFALHQSRPLPVLGTTLVAVFASWQLSLVFLPKVDWKSLDKDWVTLLVGLLQLVAAIFAILGGFTLTNAIGRYNEVRRSLLEVLTRLMSLRYYGVGFSDDGERIDELVGLIVLRAATSSAAPEDHGRQTVGQDIPSRISKLEEETLRNASTAEERGRVAETFFHLRASFSHLDAALANRVSRYEWAMIGTTTLLMLVILHYVPSYDALLSVVRAVMVASLIAIVFAIRDYDRNRPLALSRFLVFAQRASGFSDFRSPLLPLELTGTFSGRVPTGALRVIDRSGKTTCLEYSKQKRFGAAEYIFWILVFLSAISGLVLVANRLNW